MCVEWVDEWEVVAQDMTAYKFVERAGDKFMSPLPVDMRGSQHPTGEVGTILEYAFDTEVLSDYPGIYCLIEPVRTEAPMATLRVIIPKGTMIRRGRTHLMDANGKKFEVRTVNALRVIPKAEYKETPPQYWNVANTMLTAGSTTWGYVNMANAATTSNTYWVSTAV